MGLRAHRTPQGWPAAGLLLQVHPLRLPEALGAKPRAHAGWWLIFLIVGGFFCFPGVSVTSSNTGVPDISGSVYNKTQVSSAGPSSPSRPEADGPGLFPGPWAPGSAGCGSSALAVCGWSGVSPSVPPLLPCQLPAAAAGIGTALHAAPCVQMNAMALMFLVKIAPEQVNQEAVHYSPETSQ